MRRGAAGVLVGLGLLAIPASSPGGDQRSAEGGTSSQEGVLVAKDRAKRRPKAAVARITTDQVNGLTYEITSRPAHLPIDWSFTARCMKGGVIEYFPGPGDHHTKTRSTTIAGAFKLPMPDPDFCTFAVAGQIARNKLGKSVTVKIYRR